MRARVRDGIKTHRKESVARSRLEAAESQRGRQWGDGAAPWSGGLHRLARRGITCLVEAVLGEGGGEHAIQSGVRLEEGGGDWVWVCVCVVGWW